MNEKPETPRHGGNEDGIGISPSDSGTFSSARNDKGKTKSIVGKVNPDAEKENKNS